MIAIANLFGLLCNFRQVLDDLYQELQQGNRIVRTDFTVCIAVCILCSLCGQRYCSGSCLVQKYCIGDVHSAVQIGVAIECCSCRYCGGVLARSRCRNAGGVSGLGECGYDRGSNCSRCSRILSRSRCGNGCGAGCWWLLWLSVWYLW